MDVDAPSSTLRRNAVIRSRSVGALTGGYRATSQMSDRTILVTGGTGALGSAVVAAFLDAGWRVAVTWIEARELERVGEREHLVLVEADLFDEAAVDRAVAGAAGDPAAPLRAVANLVGGYAGGARVHET